jgi:hypothetical protein
VNLDIRRELRQLAGALGLEYCSSSARPFALEEDA